MILLLLTTMKIGHLNSFSKKQKWEEWAFYMLVFHTKIVFYIHKQIQSRELSGL